MWRLCQHSGTTEPATCQSLGILKPNLFWVTCSATSHPVSSLTCKCLGIIGLASHHQTVAIDHSWCPQGGSICLLPCSSSSTVDVWGLCLIGRNSSVGNRKNGHFLCCQHSRKMISIFLWLFSEREKLPVASP